MSIHDIDRHPTDEERLPHGFDAQAEADAIARLRVRLGRALREEPDPLRSGWRGWLGLGFAAAAIPPWATAGAVLALLVIVLPAGVLPSGPWGSRAAAPAPSDSAADRETDSVRPSSALTPGAASAAHVSDLCAGRGVMREVSPHVRQVVLREYGMEDVPADEYELDALITPELGGTTDARNLWPQRYASPVWHARVKDELEQRLAADVCAGRVALEQARHDIATDWIAAYRRYFHSDVPLRAHRDRLTEEAGEEVELEIRAPRRPSVGAYPEAMARLSLALMRP